MGVIHRTAPVFHIKIDTALSLERLFKIYPRLKMIKLNYHLIIIEASDILKTITNKLDIVQFYLSSLNFDLGFEQDEISFIGKAENGNYDQITLNNSIMDLYRDVI